MQEKLVVEMLHVTHIKSQLKKRLLEIPINHSGLREKHRIANDINQNVQDIELFLEELCNNEILDANVQYCCPDCRETTSLNKQLLSEYSDDDGYIECEECCNFFIPINHKTGYVFYDIINKEALLKW